MGDDAATDPLLVGYLDYLRAQGRERAVGDVTLVLTSYQRVLAGRGRRFATARTADVEAFRGFLTTPAATLSGATLAVTTQATRLGMVRAFHRWLRRRGHTVINPAATVSPPRVDQRRVRKDYLDLQEAQAFLETAAAQVAAHREGTRAWAGALRDLALVSLAVATGRRCAGLCALRAEDLHVDRAELRVEREKGQMGRVLPVAAWAVAIAGAYRDRARPIMLRGRVSPWLFVGRRAEQVGKRTYDDLVRRLHRATCAACPDLVDLPGKTISTHSLRVTCARLLFLGGCPIRIVNEILLHRRLSTTAAYTPLHLDDLRRAVTAAHPRA